MRQTRQSFRHLPGNHKHLLPGNRVAQSVPGIPQGDDADSFLAIGQLHRDVLSAPHPSAEGHDAQRPHAAGGKQKRQKIPMADAQ